MKVVLRERELPISGQRFAGCEEAGLFARADVGQVAFGEVVIADQFRAVDEIAQHRFDVGKVRSSRGEPSRRPVRPVATDDDVG